ncbi:hypothetical protein YPPY53_2254, partial [Yersinia pestis PY-53]
MMKLSKNTY